MKFHFQKLSHHRPERNHIQERKEAAAVGPIPIGPYL